ncbi:hypothetical protein SAMN05660976_03568 [Nonomuraea pusilla]|uniref:Uncharacterized protein n=1 Tax=Nonomuraea pusilla TaxID=46177 RepID=A0A1H7TPW7_9ACTN|nr:hypothetical protein SAMN05660976_03568 [Nonomuraea pusilla]
MGFRRRVPAPMPSAYRDTSRSPSGFIMSSYVRVSPPAIQSYGAPPAVTSWISGRRVLPCSSRRFAVSDDWMYALRTLYRLRRSSSGSSTDRPIASKYVGCLVSG